jgi:DNA polymerase-3 subunit epsilon
MLLNAPLAFVDIETTGMSAARERIIEVALHRVENSKLVSSFETLLNPKRKLDPFISTLTNIQQKDLANAPIFKEIAGALHAMLKGCVFVAHNVEFDYSFLAAEFARCGIAYTPQKLCTVKLSRTLFPEYERHSLDHIIARSEFKIANRHRANDDSMVLWKFYLKLFDQFDVPTIERAFVKCST